MYLGRVVEIGPTEEVLDAPQHPYTQALLSVVPEIERLEPIVLRGEIPDPTRIPRGLPVPPAVPGAGLRRGRAAGVADACRAARRCRSLPRREHQARPASVPRRCRPGILEPRTDRRVRSDVEVRWHAAGCAAARAVRRRRALAARARARAARASGPASAGSTDLGLDEPRAASPSSTSLGESRAGDRATPTARCTRRTTSAGTAARRSFPTEPGRGARSCARRSRCAAPTTRGPTPSTARCCARRTPRTSRLRPGGRSACTGRRSRRGAASCSCT